MDAVSLAIGITALYTTCRDCYNFFTNVKTAEAESLNHLRELEIQQSILKAWGFHWHIQNEDGSEPEHSDHTGRKQTKLHKYLLSNHFKAEGVFNTLSALADTLSNQEKLIKRYGIHLQPAQANQDGSRSTNNVQLTIPITEIEDVKPVISEVKNRLSVLRKFKFVLKDRDNFKKLITDLRSHSDSLYRLCPENAFDSMNIYFTMEFLARQESPAGLKQTSRLANQQAEVDRRSSVRKGYKLLASAATFKASINENRDGKQADDMTHTSVDEEQHEISYLGKGLALYEKQVVYVEMRDYRGPPLELTPEQKQQKERRRNQARFLKIWSMDDMMTRPYSKAGMDQIYESGSSDEAEQDVEPIEMVRPANPKVRALIRNFFNTFQGTDMRESVCGLDIAGIIDHTEGEHKGHCSILYRLPGTIGVQSRERPAENLRLRAPVTLQSLLGYRDKKGIQSTLGARFKLARKLVRAVCLLHSSGWLHKNIRAESVIFFPEHVSALQEDQYEIKCKIDISEPFLMGYISSRPDDVIIRKNLPSAPHIEEQNNSDRIITSRAPSMDDRSIPHQTKWRNMTGFKLDYYQHPAKHADPMRLYRHAYDVYSLGILLLEVGLWCKLKNDSCYDPDKDYDFDEEDHYEQRRWILYRYLDDLRWECGDTYADVVLSCLMIDSSDDETAKVSQRELCARIIADLEGCQA